MQYNLHSMVYEIISCICICICKIFYGKMTYVYTYILLLIVNLLLIYVLLITKIQDFQERYCNCSISAAAAQRDEYVSKLSGTKKG